MPFRSRRQQRAAFGGHIPGFSRQKAEEWADETDFDALPDRAPAEKGKPTLRSKTSSRQLTQLAYIAKVLADREREAKKHAALVEFCAKVAFAVPRPGQIRQNSSAVGAFSGKATNNFLKPPGPAASHQAVNPRLSLKNAITKATRV
jgi:hypothetical protein